MNVDENSETAMTYNVSSIPALMIFKGGKLVQQFMGVQQKPRLQQGARRGEGLTVGQPIPQAAGWVVRPTQPARREPPPAAGQRVF